MDDQYVEIVEWGQYVNSDGRPSPPRLMERVTPDRQGPLVSSLSTTLIIIVITNNIVVLSMD